MTTTQNTMIITTNKGQYFGTLNATDGSETEITVLPVGSSTGISAGKHLKGQQLKRIQIQCGDGSILATAKWYGKDSGVVYTWVGCERTSNQRANLDVAGLNHLIEDGEVIKINTTD